MSDSDEENSLSYGKINWSFNELKEVLDIQLLHLRCQAPDEEEGGCDNSISIFYCLKVRSLLRDLSNNPSDRPFFEELLLQLARTLCCKSLHGGWEYEVVGVWRDDLYAAGEREGRYLQERKALQDALRAPRPPPNLMADDGASLAAEVARTPLPLPRSKSVILARRDPELIRNGPKPIIHCIRHAEAGNGEENDFYTRDPELTEKGKQECLALSQAFNRHEHVTHLIVSPLSRCVETALNSFSPTIEAGVPVTLVPEIQAAGSCWSCIGLPPSELEEKYSEAEYGDIFDHRFVTDSWINKLEGHYACDERSVYKRVKNIFKWCRDSQDDQDGENGRREIVLITHQSVLVHFAHYWDIPTTGWSTFTFDDDWKIYETPESKMRRHASNPEQSVPYSPHGSTSSRDTFDRSKLPQKKFSTVKYRPQMKRTATADDDNPTHPRHPRVRCENFESHSLIPVGPNNATRRTIKYVESLVESGY